MAGEALNLMRTVLGEANLVSGFKPAESAPMVTHLQFIDETLIFAQVRKIKLRTQSPSLGDLKLFWVLK